MLYSRLRRGVAAAAVALSIVATGVAVDASPAAAQCQHVVRGTRLSMTPAEIARFNSIVDTKGRARIGVNLGGGNGVEVTIYKFPSGLPNNQSIVNFNASTDWHKAIGFQNACTGSVRYRYHSRSHPYPQWEQITRDTAHTIEFHKAGFLGIWHPVATFDADTLWGVIGGRYAYFNWTLD